jgi:zinc D-Ala-D-Ala carboxypeptidase
MNLSENFTLEEATFSETATRLGISNQPSPEQLENMKKAAEGMEAIRKLLGKPIRVSSWLRLPAVNKAIGGAAKSSHMDGWAIDFTCSGYGTPFEVAKALKDSDIQVDQVIHEFGRWVHVSFAPEMRGQFLTIFKPQNKYLVGVLTAEEYAKTA